MHLHWQCRTVILYSDQSGFNDNRYVQYEVLTMVLMKIQVFWNATMCKLGSVKCITVYHSVWHSIPEDLNQCVSKCRIGPPPPVKLICMPQTLHHSMITSGMQFVFPTTSDECLMWGLTLCDFVICHIRFGDMTAELLSECTFHITELIHC